MNQRLHFRELNYLKTLNGQYIMESNQQSGQAVNCYIIYDKTEDID